MSAYLLLAVPAAPLLAALAGSVLRSRARAGWLSVVAAATSLGVLILIAGQEILVETLWFQAGGLELTIGLHLSALSWWVATLVAFIALAVNLYSLSSGDDGTARFFAWMSFFAGAMLSLVLASSFLALYAAWEFVGVASWRLIGFGEDSNRAAASARLAFLMTRVGDMGLLAGWLLILVTLQTTSIDRFLQAVQGGSVSAGLATSLCLLFYAASVGKSAQLPLTAWLPEAMAGPSPVSALIHSATMVAAGVYLILRVFPLFESSPFALGVVLWVGAASALVGALVATSQFDPKRILAWSTVSQLGEMMLALGLAAPTAAAFHLTMHAIFKSCLFLGAGAVQHQTGLRDLRALGGLGRHMPLTAAAVLAASLALAGFPGFGGYWSEERILAGGLAVHPGWGLYLTVLILLAGLYISRFFAATFIRWRGSTGPEAHQPGRLTMIPLCILAAAAVLAGVLLRNAVDSWLPFSPGAHAVSAGWKLAAAAASVAGLVIGVWRTKVHGPRPVLALSWHGLTHLVEAVPAAAGRVAGAGAVGLRKPEGLLDHGARLTARSLATASAGAHRAEIILDAGARLTARSLATASAGAHRAETVLDAGARLTGGAALQSAQAADLVENAGFGALVDRAAGGLAMFGGRLRLLQTGRIYLYAMGLFLWVLVAAGLITFLGV